MLMGIQVFLRPQRRGSMSKAFGPPCECSSVQHCRLVPDTITTFFTYLILFACSVHLSGCGLIRERQGPAEDASVAIAKTSVEKPLSPEETEALLTDVAHNWFYGQGVGESLLAVGTAVVFPPYALYLAGNAVLSLSGYEEIRISEALPDSGQDLWNSLYDGVTSVPGGVTSEVTGTPYVTKQRASETLKRYLHRPEQYPGETAPAPALYAESAEDTVKAWR